MGWWPPWDWFDDDDGTECNPSKIEVPGAPMIGAGYVMLGLEARTRRAQDLIAAVPDAAGQERKPRT